MTAKLPPLSALLLFCAGCGASGELTSAEQAGKLQREGKVSEAYAAYADALCAAPGDLDLARSFVESWYELGQPGDPLARVAHCELAAGVGPYVAGLAAASREDFTGAEAALAGAQAALPTTRHAEVLYRRGLVALKAGQPAVAGGLLDQAAALAPERPDVRLALCQSKIDLGQLEPAVQVLHNLLKVKPDSRHVQQGRQLLEAAVRAAEEPLSSEVEARLTRALGALDRSELSRDDFLGLLVLANEVVHPRVLTIAGIASLRFGADREGARLLNRAAELNRLDPDPPRVLGVALLAADRASEAFVPLRTALARDPLDRELARDLAKASKSIGNKETAREAYRILVVLEPRVTENHLWLARTERQLGDLHAARRAVNEAYALDGTDIPVLLERAVINAKLAHEAPTPEERSAAADLTRGTIAELLEVSPGHPGATTILDSLDR